MDARTVIANAQVEFLHGVPVSVTAKGADAILAALKEAGYVIMKSDGEGLGSDEPKPDFDERLREFGRAYAAAREQEGE